MLVSPLTLLILQPGIFAFWVFLILVPQIHCRPRDLFAYCTISCRHVKELRIGVVKNFTVQVIVENKAEDSAYATKFILKYPDKLDYVGSYQVLFLLKMTISVTFHLTRIAPGKLPPVRYRLRTLNKRQRACSNTTVLYRQCPINERMIFIVTIIMNVVVIVTIVIIGLVIVTLTVML